MTNNEWIHKEIEKWKAEGIVDGPTAETLLLRYTAPQGRYHLGIVLAGVFAALLIGLGVISIFAANWEYLDRGMRAFAAVLPVLICGALALLAVRKSWKSNTFWEPLGLLWFISVVAGTSLVAQTYNIGGSASGLVLFTALLSLPVVWITNSTGAMVGWLIFPIAWSSMKIDEGDSMSFWLGLRTLAFLALSIPAYISFLKHKPHRFLLTMGQIATGFFYVGEIAFILLSFAGDPSSSEAVVLLIWLAALIVGVCAWVFHLPVWPMTSLLVAGGASLFTTYGMEFYIYLMSILLALATTGYGVKRLRRRYVNIGAFLLQWQILVKFCASDQDFTVKGLVMISCGLALAAINVFFVRYRNAKREGSHEPQA